MLDTVFQRCVEVLTIVGSSIVLFSLIIFPISWSQIRMIGRILGKNIKRVPRLLMLVHQLRLEKQIPLWQIGLGFPLIAMLVLLEEYEDCPAG